MSSRILYGISGIIGLAAVIITILWVRGPSAPKVSLVDFEPKTEQFDDIIAFIVEHRPETIRYKDESLSFALDAALEPGKDQDGSLFFLSLFATADHQKWNGQRKAILIAAAAEAITSYESTFAMEVASGSLGAGYIRDPLIQASLRNRLESEDQNSAFYILFKKYIIDPEAAGTTR